MEVVIAVIIFTLILCSLLCDSSYSSPTPMGIIGSGNERGSSQEHDIFELKVELAMLKRQISKLTSLSAPDALLEMVKADGTKSSPEVDGTKTIRLPYADIIIIPK